ncbi:vacuolar protein sorting-associated protein 2 homolog 3-like [Arachis hypogaea]|uniref:vacuolar protein sorting-associated protein 2 homolog 3-like n=1 Tax=Arachis hypogaea TaxID=3818 RepID=UPI003B221DB4
MATLVAQIPAVTSTILAEPLASPPPRLLLVTSVVLVNLVTSVVLLADLLCIVTSVVFSALLPCGIERKIGALQLEERKLLAEIKITAKTGNEAATKVLARQLARLRQQIANLQGSRAQMRGIATHTQAMHAHSSVAASMQGASKAMTAMNKVAPSILYI